MTPTTEKDKTMYCTENKSQKYFRFSNMCKTWGRTCIQIWIGIKMKSRILIRIGIKTMLIQNTG
jgi:hypothetical protein